jgi:hypothetical protein
MAVWMMALRVRFEPPNQDAIAHWRLARDGYRLASILQCSI